MNELEALRQRFERAQHNPPTLSRTRHQVLIPNSVSPAYDSRGQRRPVLRPQQAARQRQVQRLTSEIVEKAKQELATKAREQLTS